MTSTKKQKSSVHDRGCFFFPQKKWRQISQKYEQEREAYGDIAVSSSSRTGCHHTVKVANVGITVGGKMYGLLGQLKEIWALSPKFLFYVVWCLLYYSMLKTNKKRED